MGRPTGLAWRPLGLADDPTPGTPGRVTDEVNHLNSVANTILNQITALKKIASDDNDPLIGKYAEKIRESARDLVGTLQTVHDRYTRVASALGGWESDLVTAQGMSLKALNEAEGPYQQLQMLNAPTISAPQTSPPTPPTPQQQQAAAAHKAAVTKAQGQLNDAIGDLHKAVGFRDDRANYWAGKINDASHDSLQDSWWDSFKDFIGKWAWLIKDICTVLEVIGAVLAIIALFATGVGWILLAALIVTAVALIGRTLLAATGNGSWLDVVMDAVAVATLGVGGGLTGVGGLVGRAGRTLGEAIKVGDSIVQGARDASLTGRAISFLDRGTEIFNTLSETVSKIPGLGLVSRVLGKVADGLDGGSQFLNDFQDALRPMATTMVKDIEEKDAVLRAIRGGEELGNYVAKMNALTKVFSDSPEIGQLAARFSTEMNQARAVVLSGVVSSAGGVVAPGFPLYGPGHFGAEDSQFQFWHFKPWDKADEAMMGAVPTSVMDGIVHAVAPVVLPPPFSFAASALP